MKWLNIFYNKHTVLEKKRAKRAFAFLHEKRRQSQKILDLILYTWFENKRAKKFIFSDANKSSQNVCNEIIWIYKVYYSTEFM